MIKVTAVVNRNGKKLRVKQISKFLMTRPEFYLGIRQIMQLLCKNIYNKKAPSKIFDRFLTRL